MSCEVANSPIPEAGFASPFNVDNAQEEKVNYAALGNFDYNFGAADNGCIDPQNFSNTGSPSGHFDPTLTPDFTLDNYPPQFNAVPAAQYFQSIEQAPNVPGFPLHLQNQHLHRRSVSEPLDGALLHHHTPPRPNGPMTFHRDGQLLNVPRAGPPPIKRTKQSRTQPYQRSPRQPPSSQSRYQLRRTHAQPIHLPPTSVPHGLPINHPLHPQQMPREPRYVSSRVCTPAPEAIDPFLDASPTPAVAHMGEHPRAVFGGHQNTTPVAESVTIKMGVDELRSLITDVVQKAVEGLQPDRSTGAAALVAQQLQEVQVGGSELGDGSVTDVTAVADHGADHDVVAVSSPTGDVVDKQLDAALRRMVEEQG